MGEVEIILARISGLEARVSMLESKPGGGVARPNGASQNGGSQQRIPFPEGRVATDRELDSEWGDPQVKFDPREKYWAGPSYIDCTFSQCSAEYLDATVSYLAACIYAARKEAEKTGQPADEKKIGYKEKDAARARGWAKRIREGKVAPTPQTLVPQNSVSRSGDEGFSGSDANENYAGSDDIPF